MQQIVIEWFQQYQEVAFVISILVNVIISIVAVIPSAFLTAANVYMYGFTGGMILSFIGESLGVLVAFWLYRKGVLKWLSTREKEPKWMNRLQQVSGKEAFQLIVLLRLLPFVPSGAVTAIASVSSVSMGLFFTASTLGKAPAVLLEVYAVQEVMNNSMIGKGMITIVAIIFLGHYVYKKKTRKV
ncbi:VTT domain-containing protein [Metabacillus iocasae]|uniref:TVP38/TMEM64 family membrane protein n=1 Tax=Priestia iocasae TaxID=2291674 RepID=A0ABS2QVZ2_9BACI|nr:putative membrane protein YdjX (TVP38/TMEM64 family) [Metabacillus iocasae]